MKPPTHSIDFYYSLLLKSTVSNSKICYTTPYFIQIQTKTVQDVIEFYYDWKKTSHYKQWKKLYIPDERDVPTVIGD